MTASIPIENRLSISFDIPFLCECGNGRAVLVRNLRTDMPFSDEWRDAGPCAECSQKSRWKVVRGDDAYDVTIEGV